MYNITILFFFFRTQLHQAEDGSFKKFEFNILNSGNAILRDVASEGLSITNTIFRGDWMGETYKKENERKREWISNGVWEIVVGDTYIYIYWKHFNRIHFPVFRICRVWEYRVTTRSVTDSIFVNSLFHCSEKNGDNRCKYTVGRLVFIYIEFRISVRCIRWKAQASRKGLMISFFYLSSSPFCPLYYFRRFTNLFHIQEVSIRSTFFSLFSFFFTSFIVVIQQPSNHNSNQECAIPWLQNVRALRLLCMNVYIHLSRVAWNICPCNLCFCPLYSVICRSIFVAFTLCARI